MSTGHQSAVRTADPRALRSYAACVSHEPTQLVVLDLIGVFVFALSGGLAAVRARLDIFGVLVLATVTAIGGGIIRDTLIGSTPPAALRDWLFLAVPAAAGLVVFYWHPQVERAMRMVLVLDAAGLGLFTATGTRLALEAHLSVAGSCAIGLITGIGGGVIRDVLLRQIPVVLRREIYAVASLVGAVIVCGADRLHVPPVPSEVVAALVVFAIRIVALRRHWSAPRARDIADQAGA
jgi:uncharacterized membrane protein YeiH